MPLRRGRCLWDAGGRQGGSAHLLQVSGGAVTPERAAFILLAAVGSGQLPLGV